MTPDPSLPIVQEAERLLARTTPGEWRFVIEQKRKRHDASQFVEPEDRGTLVGAVAPGHQIRTFGHSGGTSPSGDGEFFAASKRLVRDLLSALSAALQSKEQGKTMRDHPREAASELDATAFRNTPESGRCACGVLKARSHFCVELDHCWLGAAIIEGGA